MAEKITKNTVFSNLFWKFSEKSVIEIVSFIVSIIIARLLDPSDIGIVALTTGLISIFSIFIDTGLGSALIQKLNPDDEDYSTVFFANIILCLIIYVLLFFCAPIIANYYNNVLLTKLIRILGIKVIVLAIKNVQHAYISKNMLFKKFFYSSLSGTIIAGVVGIIMALNGFGVWSIVALDLIDCVVDTFVIWITIKWRPSFVFSLSKFKTLFSYGWKIFVSGLLDEVYNRLYQLVIGKKYSPADLAYYDKGDSIPRKIVKNINSSINNVMMPVLSNSQDDLLRMKNIGKRMLTINFYIVAPILFGIMAISDNMIVLLLTEKWLPVLPYLKIMCIVYLIYPIDLCNLNIIKSLGRSDIFLKLEIIKKIIGLIILIVSSNYGIFAMVCGVLISSIIGCLINAYPNKRLINYGLIKQIKDLLPIILLNLFMYLGVYFISFINVNLYIKMLIQILCGVALYIIPSYVLKIDSFEYCFGILKNYKDKK